ncbi:MAG: hypothetical protein EOP47_16560 [Sphingobacteriaceae bacterium]|nr:MAG: hypothetical protein EOP47_16560 [Sphingobacteriaceae bacterium]
MHRLKIISHLKSYLSVTKREWNGLVVLLIVMLLIFIVPYAYKNLPKDNGISSSSINKAAAALNNSFNKNKHSANGKYKYKMGQPFFAKQEKLTVPVELNKADSASLTTIYGIGPVFARRIIKYREHLGGFVSKEQLKEVYGLNEQKYNEVSSQVTVNPVRLKKININSATFDELKRLPYLNFKQMNAMIQYRVQHGDYTSAEDLGDIAILNKEIIDKLKPYLVFK